MTLWLPRRLCRIKGEGGCRQSASLLFVGLALVHPIPFPLILHPDMVPRARENWQDVA